MRHEAIFTPIYALLNVNNHDLRSFLDFEEFDQETTVRHANGNGYW